jgi:Xaa-Pro aminopeptidase
VHQAFEAAAGVLAPGLRFIVAHKLASLAIAKGLISLGLMRGDPHEAVEAGAHALFFPHGLGHQIGLDVHDMEGLGEDYVGYGEELRRADQFGLHSLRLAKTLRPGMVHSVEPGIYFIPQLVQKWRAEHVCHDFLKYDIIEKWMSVGGIRIEEDWCITETGARRLGPAFDKRVEALERARSAQ